YSFALKCLAYESLRLVQNPGIISPPLATNSRIRPRNEKTSNDHHTDDLGSIMTSGSLMSWCAKACFFAAMPNALRHVPACGKKIIHSARALALRGKLPDRSATLLYLWYPKVVSKPQITSKDPAERDYISMSKQIMVCIKARGS
ncbi:MAG: hypothetical protein WBM69_11635, partial [Desulfobacterales bacterium]